MANNEGKLTERQKRFIDYYLEFGNATKAAIHAGYSKKSAGSMGKENLQKPQIREYINKAIAAKDSERIASQDEILAFLSDVMRGKVTEQIPLLDGEGTQILARLDAAQPKDRIKAAELLGKRYVMWTDKQEVDADMSINIQVDYGGDGE